MTKMAINKKNRKIPRDVNEAAQLLLSDLLNQHLKKLSGLTENEFDRLCDYVAPVLNEEYQIWQGNHALLESCLEISNRKDEDPARVILNRVMQIIRDMHGFLVLT